MLWRRCGSQCLWLSSAVCLTVCALCRQLRELTGRELCCYSISAKNFNNIDITMEWLVKHAKKPSA